MKSAQELLKDEFLNCYEEGEKLSPMLLQGSKVNPGQFGLKYQLFYTKAIRLVQILAPERLDEFKSYYEPDPKRKHFGYGSYSIQDYIKMFSPAKIKNFDIKGATAVNLHNQISILISLKSRIDTVLGDITGGIQSELLDAELATAKSLMKTSIRAAGALSGVVLESHLRLVAKTHKIQGKKKSPTISDLNDALKTGNIYDTPKWRTISYLGDIRNKCSHKGSTDPTPEEVEKLIEGVNWAIKTIS